MTTADEHLIADAVAGNRAALERLLVANGRWLSGYLTPRIPHALNAAVSVDDILQQTFLQAYRGISQIQSPTESSFRAWLKVIADNQLRNALQAQQRKKRGGDAKRVANEPEGDKSYDNLLEQLSEHTHTPSRSLARREAVGAVQVAIAGLDADRQQAVRLYYLGGNSLEQTAAAMDRSPAAVRGLIYRAKQQIADALDRASKWM